MAVRYRHRHYNLILAVNRAADIHLIRIPSDDTVYEFAFVVYTADRTWDDIPSQLAGVTATEKIAWPGETLRELLARPAILDQPTVCDPLGARLAADAGYQAVALGGYAIGAHLPLTSELSLADIEHAAAAVVRACGLPVMLDADINWGGAAGISRALARLEAASLAAVAVASQHLPAQMPFSEAAERDRARADQLCRIHAARSARTRLLILARCAIPAGRCYDDALSEVAGLLEAGADALLLHAPAGQLRRLAQDLPGATLICAGSPGPGPEPSAADLQGWGYQGLTRQYHRCYCARMRLTGNTGPAADSRWPRTASLTRVARPCPQRSEHREDLERKQ
jgi:methylisocitrate lyase